MTTIQAPIALAVVRRSDGLLLTLQGLQKLDLPSAKHSQGTQLEVSMAQRLAELGVFTPRLVFRWGAFSAWANSVKPVHVFEAPNWSGTPSEEAGWSTEEEIARGQRTELYARLFAKLRSGGASRFESASPVILEAGQAKKPVSSCPKCRATLKLRNRKPGEAARWDCRSCSSSWELGRGELRRCPPVGA